MKKDSIRPLWGFFNVEGFEEQGLFNKKIQCIRPLWGFFNL